MLQWMFSQMKRYADSLAILIPQCNLNIHLTPFYVLAKDPYLALLIQCINDGTFYIVLRLKALYYYFTLDKISFAGSLIDQDYISVDTF